MPIVPAKCPSCGGYIKVSDEKDAAICEYCGNAFIVQDAIQNYSSSVTIQANVVNVVDKSDFEVVAGKLIGYHGSSISVIIPDGVIEIGPNCFAGLYIESVVFPSSLRKIGNSSFAGCQCLKTIVLPDSVVCIGESAFDGCTALQTVKSSASLEYVGFSAFENCSSLVCFTPFPTTVDLIYGDDTLPGMTNLPIKADLMVDANRIDFIRRVFPNTPLYSEQVVPFQEHELDRKKETEKQIQILAQSKLNRLKIKSLVSLFIIHLMYIILALAIMSKSSSWLFSILTGLYSLVCMGGTERILVYYRKQVFDKLHKHGDVEYDIRSVLSNPQKAHFTKCLCIIDFFLTVFDVILCIWLKQDLSILVYILCHIFPFGFRFFEAVEGE